MTAIYPSTSAAQMFVPLPVRLSTTGAAAPITPANAPTGTPADFNLTVADSAGTPLVNQDLATAMPAGITASLSVRGLLLVFDPSVYTVPTLYRITFTYTDPDYQNVYSTFQWGGWIDALIASVEIASTEATVARQLVGNRIDVDDPAAPTELTYYADDNTTPIATRTIANADGSAINPAQVLVLGRATP